MCTLKRTNVRCYGLSSLIASSENLCVYDMPRRHLHTFAMQLPMSKALANRGETIFSYFVH